jgi:hypothetical protein
LGPNQKDPKRAYRVSTTPHFIRRTNKKRLSTEQHMRLEEQAVIIRNKSDSNGAKERCGQQPVKRPRREVPTKI